MIKEQKRGIFEQMPNNQISELRVSQLIFKPNLASQQNQTSYRNSSYQPIIVKVEKVPEQEISGKFIPMKVTRSSAIFENPRISDNSENNRRHVLRQSVCENQENRRIEDFREKNMSISREISPNRKLILAESSGNNKLYPSFTHEQNGQLNLNNSKNEKTRFQNLSQTEEKNGLKYPRSEIQNGNPPSTPKFGQINSQNQQSFPNQLTHSVILPQNESQTHFLKTTPKQIYRGFSQGRNDNAFPTNTIDNDLCRNNITQLKMGNKGTEREGTNQIGLSTKSNMQLISDFKLRNQKNSDQRQNPELMNKNAYQPEKQNSQPIDLKNSLLLYQKNHNDQSSSNQKSPDAQNISENDRNVNKQPDQEPFVNFDNSNLRDSLFIASKNLQTHSPPSLH